MNLPINRDTIATFAIAELHFSTDLTDSIASCDSLLEFIELAYIELRDADDLHDTLNPTDDDARADAILALLDDDDTRIYIIDTMLDFLRDSNALP